MKITSIETVHLAEFPAVIWVQIKTDSGHVGLGETFFGPRAVAGCVHEMFAPMLIGKDEGVEFCVRLWEGDRVYEFLGQ